MSKRNAILTAATRLFSTNGFEQTSMSELSRVTGAASGTIFHHFKNKEDLFLNVLEQCRNDIVNAFEQHQKNNLYKSGIDLVEGILQFYLHLSGELKDQFLLLHRHYPYQMAKTNVICRTCLESIYTCLLQIFENAITKGIQDGSIKSRSAEHSAMIIYAMVDGIARLNTYQIYHAASLYQDIITSCRQMLTVKPTQERTH